MGSKESDMTEYTCKYMHSDSVGANTDSLDSKHLHELSCRGGPSKELRTSYHQPEAFREGQKERGDLAPYVLPTFQNLPC